MKKIDLLKLVDDLEDNLYEHLQSHEELRIESESSYSESVIVGSKNAYIRVSIAFLKFASLGSDANPLEIKSLFNECGAVWPVSAYVTDNDFDAQTLASDFSGD